MTTYIEFKEVKDILVSRGWTEETNEWYDGETWDCENSPGIVEFSKEGAYGKIVLSICPDVSDEEEGEKIPMEDERIQVDRIAWNTEVRLGFNYYSYYNPGNIEEDDVISLPIYRIMEEKEELKIRDTDYSFNKYEETEALTPENISRLIDIVEMGHGFLIEYLSFVSKGIEKVERDFRPVFLKYDFTIPTHCMFSSGCYTEGDLEVPNWSYSHETAEGEITFYVEPFGGALRSFNDFLGHIPNLMEMSSEEFEKILVAWMKEGNSYLTEGFKYLFDENPKTNKYTFRNSISFSEDIRMDKEGRRGDWDLTDEELDTIVVDDPSMAYYKLKRDDKIRARVSQSNGESK